MRIKRSGGNSGDPVLAHQVGCLFADRLRVAFGRAAWLNIPAEQDSRKTSPVCFNRTKIEVVYRQKFG